MDYRNYICVTGESDFRDFTPWWENNLPAYLIAYCNEGFAELSVHFEPYIFSEGMMAIISFDMFPSFSDISENFKVSYCLFDRNFGDEIFYDIPAAFLDISYRHPIAKVNDDLNDWIELLLKTGAKKDIPYKKVLLHNILQCIFWCSYNIWETRYGKQPSTYKMKNLEEICTKFYNLVFDHFKEHRRISFYADALCISPNYLAIVLRRIAKESPKEVIDRQVTLEIKYMLKNTSMTVAEIAGELNFPDTSYLCRFFRRNTGMTVSEFRIKK